MVHNSKSLLLVLYAIIIFGVLQTFFKLLVHRYFKEEIWRRRAGSGFTGHQVFVFGGGKCQVPENRQLDIFLISIIAKDSWA